MNSLMAKTARTAALAALAMVALPARPIRAQSLCRELRRVLMAEAASATFDYATSQRGYSRGATEQNPVFGSARPGLIRMYAIGVPLDLAYEIPGAKMSRSRRAWLRWTGRGLEWWPVAVHVEYGARNLYYQSSTTSVAGGQIRPRFRP